VCTLMLMHAKGKAAIDQQLRHIRETIYLDHAILDLHFAAHHSDMFAVATSNGRIDCYSLISIPRQKALQKVRALHVCDPSVMVLSLAWIPCPRGDQDLLSASLSDGQIATLATNSSDDAVALVQAHTLQAWTLAWSASQNRGPRRVLYSGGDDSVLCKHELSRLQSKTSKDVPEKVIDVVEIPSVSRFSPYPNPDRVAYMPISADAKTHTAGVTAILPLASNDAEDEVIITGSYDGYIRVLNFATGSRRSKLLADLQLGGGVWRLKALRTSDSHVENDSTINVLASCMHAGSRLLEISSTTNKTWNIRLLAKFTELESMNYASDARNSLPDEQNQGLMIVSGGFYDRKLCLWTFEAA